MNALKSGVFTDRSLTDHGIEYAEDENKVRQYIDRIVQVIDCDDEVEQALATRYARTEAPRVSWRPGYLVPAPVGTGS